MIINLVPTYYRFFADLASSFPFEEERRTPQGIARIIREPVGVCALVLP
jgi:acyl-CoA reductase-like NAD-dependent aldehyde dehydrogenase